MCVKAIINGVDCETAAELRGLGVTSFVRDPRYAADGKDDSCLCWLDLQQTLVTSGLQNVRLDDYGDWAAETK